MARLFQRPVPALLPVILAMAVLLPACSRTTGSDRTAGTSNWGSTTNLVDWPFAGRRAADPPPRSEMAAIRKEETTGTVQALVGDGPDPSPAARRPGTLRIWMAGDPDQPAGTDASRYVQADVTPLGEAEAEAGGTTPPPETPLRGFSPTP